MLKFSNFINNYIIPNETQTSNNAYKGSGIVEFTQGTLLNPNSSFYVSGILNHKAFAIATYIVLAFFILAVLAVLFTLILFFVKFVCEYKSIDFDELLLKMLNIVEQEISSLSNVIFFWLTFISLITYHLYSYMVLGEISAAWVVISYILLMFVYMVVLFPLWIMKNQGIYANIYIAGSSTRTSLAFDYIMDNIAIFAYFLRINIQLIRFVIVTGTFLMYNEMCVTYTKYGLLSSYNSSNLVTYLDYVNYSLSAFVAIFLRLVFEVSHFWILFFIQGTTFSVVLIVLMQFLYTGYVIYKLNNFFKEKSKQS